MRKLKFAVLAFLVRTVGRLSTGVDMSFKYGFTSGMMLDYIYENKAHGRFLIGKIIDRAYLDNIGWKAIRQRKDNLKIFLKDSAGDNRRAGRKTVVLDVASGPARYLIEVLTELKGEDVSAACQDIDERWIAKGNAIAREYGLDNIRFEKGDAFDLDLLSKVDPRPNIVVSSGFYDWITDDELVKRSLFYISKIIDEHGTIIFTNQSGHRQMEMVSSVFVDFNKEPLRMKVRDPRLLEKWAKEAGFKNLKTVSDEWGLYSVTRGEK